MKDGNLKTEGGPFNACPKIARRLELTDMIQRARIFPMQKSADRGGAGGGGGLG